MLESLFFLAAGLLLLIGGAQLLVQGASGLAGKLGVSPTVIGLTIVAFGTSAPELAVSIHSTLRGNSALALGNVVGSNIANIGLVLGLMALIYPVHFRDAAVRLDLPLSIGIFVFMLALLADGALTLRDGMALTAGLVIFILYSYRQDRGAEARPVRTVSGRRRPGPQRRPWAARAPWLLLCLAAGCALLGYGSHLFVEGAVDLAQAAGVSEATIGLTLVAVGTSLPELATCLVAAWRRQPDLAVGNIIGSNIFNVLGILGITALFGSVSAAQFSPVDFAVALAFSLALLPLAYTRRLLSRPEGALLVAAYALYLAHLTHP